MYSHIKSRIRNGIRNEDSLVFLPEYNKYFLILFRITI